MFDVCCRRASENGKVAHFKWINWFRNADLFLCTFGVIILKAVGAVDNSLCVSGDVVDPINDIVSDIVYKVSNFIDTIHNPRFNVFLELSNPRADVVYDLHDLTVNKVASPTFNVLYCFTDNSSKIIDDVFYCVAYNFRSIFYPFLSVRDDLSAKVNSSVNNSSNPGWIPPAATDLGEHKTVHFWMEFRLLHHHFCHFCLFLRGDSLEVQALEGVYPFIEIFNLGLSKLVS